MDWLTTGPTTLVHTSGNSTTLTCVNDELRDASDHFPPLIARKATSHAPA